MGVRSSQKIKLVKNSPLSMTAGTAAEKSADAKRFGTTGKFLTNHGVALLEIDLDSKTPTGLQKQTIATKLAGVLEDIIRRAEPLHPEWQSEESSYRNLQLTEFQDLKIGKRDLFSLRISMSLPHKLSNGTIIATTSYQVKIDSEALAPNSGSASPLMELDYSFDSDGSLVEWKINKPLGNDAEIVRLLSNAVENLIEYGKKTKFSAKF